MRSLLFLICAILLGSFSSFSAREAKAWGEFGHLTVCDLAYRNLTKTSRAELDKLFQVKSGGITVPAKGHTAERHYTSFNLGCLEEDTRPREHPGDHFINVDRSTTSITDNVCPGGGECILAGIRRDFDTLKDSANSNEDRVFALMALGHWMGDIHQPLHVSFKDDAGGNSIKVKLKGGCGTSKEAKPTNLHAVWDDCLLEAGLFERVRKRADFKTTWGPRTITYRAVDSLQANTTLTDEKALVGTDPWKWANESYQITLKPEVLYCTVIAGVCQYSAEIVSLPHDGEQRLQLIDQGYLTAFAGVAEARVKKAGFRLAHLVNLALDPEYSEPIQNSTQQP